MPLDSKVRAQCAALLPGEQIHYLFPVTSLVVHHSAARSFYVAITERWIALISRSMVRGRPTGVYARYHRDTQLGPFDTRFGPTIQLGPWQLEVADDYAAQVLAADAEIRAPDFAVEDPFGDLGPGSTDAGPQAER